MTLRDRLITAALVVAFLIAYAWASHEDYREAQRGTTYHWQAQR